jgi:hypothetical protein
MGDEGGVIPDLKFLSGYGLVVFHGSVPSFVEGK